MGGRIVEVAPHCAGLKMLFTSLYVSLMLLYWNRAIKSLAKTTFLLISAVLISIGANILRNSLLTILYGTGQNEDKMRSHRGHNDYQEVNPCSLALIFVRVSYFFYFL